MSDKRGLIYCENQFGTNPFCVVKLIEIIISFTISFIIIYDMISRYLQQRKVLNLFFGLSALMLASLTCNIGYCLDHQILAFNFLQGFFYNAYYSSIVFYVAYKLFLVMKLREVYITIIKICYGLSIGFLVGVVIKKFVITEPSCSQLWYIIVSAISIFFSVILTIIGVRYTQKQNEKIQGIQNPIHYKNPLPDIWIWISVNIFSQLVSFIQSLVFQFQPNLHCKFSTNFTVNQAVKLTFVILSYYVGMIATIIFFRNKHKRQKQNFSIENNKTTVRRPSINIELIDQINFN